MVLVVALTTAVVSLVSTGGPAAAPAWIQGLTGTIVAQAFDGVPVTAAPDGAHQRRYATLRGFSSQPAFAAAPDGHLLVRTIGMGNPSPSRYWSFVAVDGGDFSHTA